MDQTDYTKLITDEVNIIIANYWTFLELNWPIIHNRFKHRTEIKHIKFTEKIKDILLKELGYTGVFFF